MKKRFIITFDKLIAALLAVVGYGAVSCSMPSEYGTPHAGYRIKGTVTADTEAKEPIKGIHIAFGGEPGHYFDTVYTNENGAYHIELGGMLIDRVYVKFEDMDGIDNGGEFAADSTGVAFTEADLIEEGKGNWDLGVYEKTVNFTMKQKEQTEE